jgi:hypothetical protein
MKIGKLKPGQHPWLQESLMDATSQWTGFGEFPSINPITIVGQCLHSQLPCKWQFQPVVYIAYDGPQLMGIIALAPDGNSRNRWIIQGLAVHPGESSLEVGSNLINYVVHQYGANGIQTFIATIESSKETVLGILKYSGFRFGSRRHQYEHQLQASHTVTTTLLEGPLVLHSHQKSSLIWRPFHPTDIPQLVILHHDQLIPELRTSLEKGPGDYNSSLLKRVQEKLEGSWFRRWVLEDTEHHQLAASAGFSSNNYRDYHVELMVSPAWQESIEDILDLCIQQMLKSTSRPKVTLSAFEFEKPLLIALATKGFTHAYSEEMLLKDYWIPASGQARGLNNPLELFTGKTSPACSKT